MLETITHLINRINVLAAGGLVVPAPNPAGTGGDATTGTVATTVGGAGSIADVAAGTASYSTNQPAGLFDSPFMLIGIWVLVFGGFWLLMIRPQRKREKKLKELQSSIKAGDNVVTTSGMFGKVSDVGTDCFVVEMGISGRTVKIPVAKNDVLGVREPVLTPPPKDSAE